MLDKGFSSRSGVLKADEVRIFDRALTENEIKRIYNRTKPSSMTGSDLRTGVWESEMMQKVNNLEFGASIGSGEDLYGDIGTDEDNDGTIDDTTGWVLLDNKGGSGRIVRSATVTGPRSSSSW